MKIWGMGDNQDVKDICVGRPLSFLRKVKRCSDDEEVVSLDGQSLNGCHVNDWGACWAKGGIGRGTGNSISLHNWYLHHRQLEKET